MGDRRSDAEALTRTRPWPLVVRRARPGDEEAVLGFATNTWDGWDYIPNAWPVWIDALDGVLLVGCTPEASGRGAAVDRDGHPLQAGRSVAIARVAMVSASEAWLEGIRVDPRVRSFDIGTDMQTAELHWAAANGATVVRYATGARNEGSHRLGARHGFDLLVAFRSWWWTEDPDADGDDPNAYDPATRAAATARRQALLAAFAREGWIAPVGDAESLWERVASDPTFIGGARLYEARPWAMGELIYRAFVDHIGRGEVIARQPHDGDGTADWALAILPRTQPPAEDSSLRLALLVGQGAAPLELVEKARSLAGRTVRFRVPENGAMFDGSEAAFHSAGYRSAEWRLHILARPMDAEHPIPEPDPVAVIMADEARPGLRPVS
jgi:GNAT superfamily N-acetyltransferase